MRLDVDWKWANYVELKAGSSWVGTALGTGLIRDRVRGRVEVTQVHLQQVDLCFNLILIKL